MHWDACGLAGRLDRGKKQGDQHGDDRDHHQEFDQGEASTLHPVISRNVCAGDRGVRWRLPRDGSRRAGYQGLEALYGCVAYVRGPVPRNPCIPLRKGGGLRGSDPFPFPPYEGSAVRVFGDVDDTMLRSRFCLLKDPVGRRMIAQHTLFHLLVPAAARTRSFPPAIAPGVVQILPQVVAQLGRCRRLAQQVEQRGTSTNSPTDTSCRFTS